MAKARFRLPTATAFPTGPRRTGPPSKSPTSGSQSSSPACRLPAVTRRRRCTWFTCRRNGCGPSGTSTTPTGATTDARLTPEPTSNSWKKSRRCGSTSTRRRCRRRRRCFRCRRSRRNRRRRKVATRQSLSTVQPASAGRASPSCATSCSTASTTTSTSTYPRFWATCGSRGC